jgi:hypothetical protein
MNHQAGAGAREPGQHLSVADRGDREQSAVAEGEERSTPVALSPGQLLGRAGRCQGRSKCSRGPLGDQYPRRLLGCPPQRRNATVYESTRGMVSPRLRLACWCRTSRAVAAGRGSALTLHANDIASKQRATQDGHISAERELRQTVPDAARRRTYSTVLMQLRDHAHRTGALRRGTRPRVALTLSSLADCKRERLAWRSLRTRRRRLAPAAVACATRAFR